MTKEPEKNSAPTVTPEKETEVTDVVTQPEEEVTTPAEDTNPEGKDKAEEPDTEDSDSTDNKTEEDDPDIAKDDEEFRNVGEVKKLRKRNQSLGNRLKEAVREKEEAVKALEEYKANPGKSSEANLEELTTLRAELAKYTDKEKEESKKAALLEKGLPVELMAALKGEEEEWRATLELISKNLPTGGKRLDNDTVTNGLNQKYKTDTMTAKEKNELALKMARIRG
jgi:hypothetical protein